MILWRISVFGDLTGTGGELSVGRWHTPAEGKRIVYLSEDPASALLENLVNLKGRPQRTPDQFQLLRIETAPEPNFETIWEDALTDHWRDNFAETQALGDQWLKQRSIALLRVPSACSPESTNYLFNPLHPDASKISVSWSRWIRYDRRLFRISE
jgi:RES domain-containing protein